MTPERIAALRDLRSYPHGSDVIREMLDEIERLHADVGTLSQIASDALMLASYGSTSRLSAKRSAMVTNLVGEFLAWDKARTRREEATA